jgi:hypothetical protein
MAEGAPRRRSWSTGRAVSTAALMAEPSPAPAPRRSLGENLAVLLVGQIRIVEHPGAHPDGHPCNEVTGGCQAGSRCGRGARPRRPPAGSSLGDHRPQTGPAAPHAGGPEKRVASHGGRGRPLEPSMGAPTVPSRPDTRRVSRYRSGRLPLTRCDATFGCQLGSGGRCGHDAGPRQCARGAF